MSRAGRILLAAVVALGACAPPRDVPPDPDDLPLLGTKPLAPLPKVAFTMPDTRGAPYDFRARTDGRIALLFFGYTYCPDVCPLHMATLAAALGELPPEVRERVSLVFVTVDPRRDTPERLERWLASFDSSFVGVRGTPEQVEEALAFYRYPAPEYGPEDTGYLVGHPAFVYAFAPDNLGRAMYGAETRSTTWAHDLTLMAGHDWSAADTAGAVSGSATEGVLGSAGGVLVLQAIVVEPAAGTTAAAYVTLLNAGQAPDTLLSVTAALAGGSGIHETAVLDGVSTMRPLAALPLPRGETVRMAPGGVHVMLHDLDPAPRAGQTLELTVKTALGGAVTVRARVLAYADLPR